LAHAPLLHPPEYTKDYILYLATSTSTIAMVLVQDDSNDEEHVIYYLSKSLSGPELRYSHVEKLALAAVIVVQRFRHYILLRTTTVIADSNPMYHVLTCQVLGGKYSKLIVILQEFDLEFTKAKAKKSLVFVELICAFPRADENIEPRDSLPDESLFLINTSNPWYRDILLYLQTKRFQSNISREERRRIRHHSRCYLILDDTLYHRGIDTILRRCLTHEEAERVLNDCHLGACGGHLSGMATTQKILCAGYFWSSIFKDCIEAVKKCPPCQIFNKKARTHPMSLHPIIAIGPFAKWGIDFMQCKPTSAGGYGYIIVIIDCFTKWAEAMPTFLNDGRTAALFLFNHIITHFGVPRAIVTDHGAHFKNQMMSELHVKLGFLHENSSPYYPQVNGQVEAINKVLKTMIQRMVGENKTSWHLQLFSALWAYRTSVKTSIGFTPFQLVYGIEAILLIECEIPSLKLKVELCWQPIIFLIALKKRCLHPLSHQ
jgi:transposase InsO family protein